MKEIQRVWKDTVWKKNLFADERKGIYESYVRSAMLYGSKPWCLRENEVAILTRAERSMMRVTCSVKLVDKRNTEELMDMLGLKEAADKLARVYGGMVMF